MSARPTTLPASLRLLIVHKVVSPATYPCSLCATTYGAVAMKPAWRAYLRRLSLGVAFFHRPDFRAPTPISPPRRCR